MFILNSVICFDDSILAALHIIKTDAVASLSDLMVYVGWMEPLTLQEVKYLRLV